MLRVWVGQEWGHYAGVPFGHVGGTLAFALVYVGTRRWFGLLPRNGLVIAASMLAHGPQDVAVGEEDVLVCPQLARTVGFLDWSRHSELFADAYDGTSRWIEDRLRQDDQGLRAVLGRDGAQRPADREAPAAAPASRE